MVPSPTIRLQLRVPQMCVACITACQNKKAECPCGRARHARAATRLSLRLLFLGPRYSKTRGFPSPARAGDGFMNFPDWMPYEKGVRRNASRQLSEALFAPTSAGREANGKMMFREDCKI